tara:strand:- start:18 stop:209 length:192 start_codon:yes stop_codon:yes gene_type:complete
VELHLLPDRKLLETGDTFFKAWNIGRRRIGRIIQEVLPDPDRALDGMGVYSIRSGEMHGSMAQ